MASPTMNVRVPEKLREDFALKCKELNVDEPTIVRKFIQAFVDDRMVIKPTKLEIKLQGK